MVSIMEIMQLCRLCLVKEQVNIPIFEQPGDIREVFLKISACLPVKVSKEDKLPKKICDGCSYKLDLLYQFSNTCANAEKQLLTWLNQLNSDTMKEDADIAHQTQTSQPHPVKQEMLDIADNGNDTANSEYLLQQQFEGSDLAAVESHDENGGGDDGGGDDSSDDEPLAKRRKRLIKSHTDTGPLSGLHSVAHMAVTKTEDASDSDGDDNADDPEPSFVSVGTDDGQQPGPSGLGKASTDIPSEQSDDETSGYECELCEQIFPTQNSFIQHHTREDVCGLVCCTCDATFMASADLFQHQQTHKIGQIVIQPADIQFQEYSEEVEAVLNIPSNDDDDDVDASNDLLYILDDSQCVNEVIIEDNNQELPQKVSNRSADCLSIVQVDHGYMMPNILPDKIDSIKKVKRKESHSGHSDSDDPELTNVLVPTTSKRSYTSTKVRQAPPKRRHELPDFSASNYVILTPNDDVDIMHYKCLRCEQLFINKFVFLRHIEKGKCFVNNCDVCSAVFEKNSEFYEHYILEHTDRAICNFCFRTFMYEKNVKEHMLRHLDQFRHRCDVCNKGFYTVREYRNHYKNRHMGIRHRCDECGRSFADEYYFKRHIATHTKRTGLGETS